MLNMLGVSLQNSVARSDLVPEICEILMQTYILRYQFEIWSQCYLFRGLVVLWKFFSQ